MKTVALLTFLLIVSPTAWSRIGETLEQCIARYGEPVGKRTAPPYEDSPIRNQRPFFMFEAEVAGKRMRIQAELEDGKVIEMCYFPLFKENLTPEHAMAILETYGERKNWQMGFTPQIGESPLGYLEESRYLNNRKEKLYANAGAADDNWEGLRIRCAKFLQKHNQWDVAKNNHRDLGEVIMERIPMEYPEDRATTKARIDKAWADLEAKRGPLGKRP